MNELSKAYLYLGRIVRKFSFRGEVLAKLETSYFQDISGWKVLHIKIDSDYVPFSIINVVPHNKGLTRLKLETVDSEDKADALLRSEIYFPASILPKKSGNDFYPHEIIDYLAQDINYGILGKVTRIDQNTMQPIMHIVEKDNEILVPLVKELIDKIDRNNKTIHLKVPEGLVELYRF